MFVSLVYDSRDANTEHPESSLGASDTVEEAWDEIVKYLQKIDTANLNFIVKAEVIACD